jgi:microcompartment protein CcmL/EutN
MQNKAIGLVELNSIAAGFDVTDSMMKAADVEVVLSRTICSGKYMVIVGGEVSAVRSSVQAGAERWPGTVIDQMVIASVHESLFPAIGGSNVIDDLKSLGVIESFSVASLIEAADAAAKAANIQLIEVRLAMALGGKAFVTLTGDVSSVRAAVEAGEAVVAAKGLLVASTVIPAPSKGLYRNVI